jgi:transcriptional regulator with XRE-family HTH domain
MDEDTGTTRVGAAVRSARLYRGLSLDVVAGLAGHSKSWLSKVERGLLPLERRSDIAALADVLQVSPADLTGRPHLGEPGRRRGADAAAVVQIRKALQDVPDPAGAGEADQLAADAEVMRGLHLSLDLAGLGEVLPGLLTRLRATLAAVHHAEDRTRLLRAYFWAGNAAETMLRNLGHFDLAWIAALSVREAAEGLGDPVWLAAAEFHRAHALVPAGAARAALAHASAGADLASTTPGPDAVGAHGALQLAAAYAAAVAGQTDEAADRVAAAERLAAGDTGRAFTRGFAFGAPNAMVHRMHVALEAGMPQQVLAAARQLPPEGLPDPERRATYWVDLGRAHAMMHRDEEAVRMLRRAEGIAPARVRLHPVVPGVLADMRDRRQRAAVGRELRGLLYRMGLPH